MDAYISYLPPHHPLEKVAFQYAGNQGLYRIVEIATLLINLSRKFEFL